MALRQFARQAVSRCGLRVLPSELSGSAGSEFGSALRATACRSFATVIEGLKYAKSHEWTKVDGDTVLIGISDFAQAELGDVVYVELPEVGAELKKAETFGVVESVKAASDVYSPVSGEVLEVNSALVEDPSKVNTSPFEDGWMMKVKLSDPSELDDLMDSVAYEATCVDH